MNSASAGRPMITAPRPEHFNGSYWAYTRKIDSALRRTYAPIDGNSRDSRVFGFVRIGTWSTATASLPGLDDRLERVGELRDRLHLERRLAVVGPEARGGVGDLGRGGMAHDPRAEPLEQLLGGREVLDRLDLPVADDHVGLAAQDRADQLGDVGPLVLVVGVGVDDHVGAELEARVQPGLEGGGQALVVRQPDDVVDAVLARDLDGAVARAVVDDQPLDDVEPGHLARQPRRASAGSCSSSLKQGIWMMSFMG